MSVANHSSDGPPPLNPLSPYTPGTSFDKDLHLYLTKAVPEPGTKKSLELTESMEDHQVIKSRLNNLEIYRARIWPNIIPGLDRAVRVEYFKRQFGLWRIFPINDFPEEILLEIFHYAVWATRHVYPSALYLLRLTWVCKRWRYAAIHDMLLWNTISFKDPPPYDRSLAFFERAGTAPLNLYIDERNEKWYEDQMNVGGTLSEDNHPYTPAMIGALMDRLLQKIHLIRSWIFILDTWPSALTVLSKIRDAGVAPASLEHFELHRTGRPLLWIGPNFEPEDHREPIPICDGRVIPKLDYLCLSGVPTDWNSQCISNLAVLDLRKLAMESNPTLDQFRNILSASPKLCKLALDAAGPQPSADFLYPPGLQPIELTCLTVLMLGDFTVHYMPYCLETFRAPNLIEFMITNMTGSDCGRLFDALTGRFPEVRMLTLYGIDMEDSPSNKRRVISWLKSMPKISVLKVAHVSTHVFRAFFEDPRRWDGSVVDIFTPRTGIIPLCPNLEILDYHVLPLDIVMKFIDGRKSMNLPLKKLYILSDWFIRMPLEDRNMLAHMIPLYPFYPGDPHPEELVIRYSWCQSKGLRMIQY